MLAELLARTTAPIGHLDLDVTPQEAWDALAESPTAQLIDVRTSAEWAFVGVPALGQLGKKPLTLSWRMFPNFDVNPNFVGQLSSVIPDTATPLFFLCRSGGRSLDAALAMREAGYDACFNIAGGFEGDLDQAQHRGAKNGWKAANLAWEQN